MITLAFAAFVAFAASVSLVDWRRGWLLALIVGVLQDPARKLTPGSPVVMTFSILAVYAVILFSAQQTLQRNLSDLARRYGRIYLTGGLVFVFLVIAAVNGLATFGIDNWKVPMLSFIIYLMPIPAVAFGYAYLDSEERLIGLFRLYAVLTSIALIGTPLEYYKVHSAALGMVSLPEGFIRYMPGIQIRILSGFYRAPDIMGWHAAMLTIIGITMAFKRESLKASAPWIFAIAWGFTNCLLSGRRKATYMVAVFGIAFVWRYIRRMNVTRIVSFAAIAIVIAFVVHKVSSNEESSVYTQGTVVTSDEIFSRLEGGVVTTVEQFGFLGAGLGTATQGAYHLVKSSESSLLGWQEGGLGKLTVELGVPGLMAVALFALALMWTLILLTGFPDEADSSQLIRVALFGIVVANIVNFLVSAQAYSDPVLTLMSAFFVGAMLATPALQERREIAEMLTAPQQELASARA
jgi:hypothetical protein